METPDTILHRFLNHIEENEEHDSVLDYLQVHIKINYGYEGVVVFAQHYVDGKLTLGKDELMKKILYAQDNSPSMNHG